MNELVVIETLNPVEIFANNGLESLLVSVENKVRAFKPDMTTESGREAIRGVAYKVARSKTALDKMGKELTDDWRKKTDLVNSQRRIAFDRLEALQVEVRKPLTDWENVEKNRVKSLEDRLLELTNCGLDTAFITTQEGLKDRILKANSLYQHNWQEFQDKAEAAYQVTKTDLDTKLEDLIKFQAEKAELEKLRKEAADREQKEREQRIATAAAAKAKEEAESKAENDRLVAEQAAKAQEAKAIAEKEAAEKRAKDAEAAKKALEDKLAKEAEIKAQKEAEATKFTYAKGSYQEIVFNWGANNGYTFVTSEILDLLDALGLKEKKAA